MGSDNTRPFSFTYMYFFLKEIIFFHRLAISIFFPYLSEIFKFSSAHCCKLFLTVVFFSSSFSLLKIHFTNFLSPLITSLSLPLFTLFSLPLWLSVSRRCSRPLSYHPFPSTRQSFPFHIPLFLCSSLPLLHYFFLLPYCLHSAVAPSLFTSSLSSSLAFFSASFAPPSSPFLFLLYFSVSHFPFHYFPSLFFSFGNFFLFRIL